MNRCRMTDRTQKIKEEITKMILKLLKRRMVPGISGLQVNMSQLQTWAIPGNFEAQELSLSIHKLKKTSEIRNICLHIGISYCLEYEGWKRRYILSTEFILSRERDYSGPGIFCDENLMQIFLHRSSQTEGDSSQIMQL